MAQWANCSEGSGTADSVVADSLCLASEMQTRRRRRRRLVADAGSQWQWLRDTSADHWPTPGVASAFGPLFAPLLSRSSAVAVHTGLMVQRTVRPRRRRHADGGFFTHAIDGGISRGHGHLDSARRGVAIRGRPGSAPGCGGPRGRPQRPPPAAVNGPPACSACAPRGCGRSAS